MSFNNYIYFGYDTVTYCDSCNNFLKELGGCQKQGHRKFELGKDYTINENNCYDCNYFELAEDKKEMINHPIHYTQGIEAIDYIESHKLSFCLGNVVKYITRAKHKGTELQDLKKASWYLDREIKRLEKGE